MTDERIARAMASLVAEREKPALDDPRWDALADGTLDPEGVRELRAWAERDDEARRAFELFRPLDDAAIASGTERALGENNPKQGRVLPFRRAAVGVTSMLAIAAGLVLFLRTRDDPLPGYEAIVRGGDVSTRGDAPVAQEGPDAPRKLGRGAELEVVLRPASAASGVAARAFLACGASIVPVRTPEMNETGTARLAGTREELFASAPKGRCELLLFVGREARLPASAADARARSTTTLGLVRVSVPLLFEDP